MCSMNRAGIKEHPYTKKINLYSYLKSKIKINHGPKCKLQNHKISRRKHRRASVQDGDIDMLHFHAQPKEG